MKYRSGTSAPGNRWGLRVGTEIVASTVIGLGLGFWLDRWLGTRPWMLLLFGVFGVIAGFVNLYYAMGLEQGRDSPESDSEE